MAYRVGIIGCGCMAGYIDDTVQGYEAAILPYCHAAAFQQVDETEVVAAVDIDAAARERLMSRWGVPRGYQSYQEMIEAEKPDIVSIATPATVHAQITIWAAEHGVKGIYCEKAMCCSLREADHMVDAVHGTGVAFNLGTTRRYHPGYHRMREVIRSGAIGEPKAVVSYPAGTLMFVGSHCFDLMLFLLGDPEVERVQGYLAPGEYDLRENRIGYDPVGGGTIQFRGGAQGHQLMVPGAWDWEVLGTEGAVRAMNNGIHWSLRAVGPRQGSFVLWEEKGFPAYERFSPTVNLIRDLIHAMETGEPTLGNVEIARRGMEISIGIAESHRQGSAWVPVPGKNRELYIVSN